MKILGAKKMSRGRKNSVYQNEIHFNSILKSSIGHKGIQAPVRKAFPGASWQISLTEVSESFDVLRLPSVAASTIRIG